MWVSEGEIFDTDIPIELNSKWNILIGFYGDMSNWSKVEIDNYIGRHLTLFPDSKAISMSSISVKLGYYLEYLWTRVRTHADSLIYKKYNEDIPLLYEEDIYEKDKETGSIVNIVNGEVKYNLIHEKGTPVLDSKGMPLYRHRVGDIILDSNNKPIIESPRSLFHRMEIMVVDAAYLFANDELTGNYRKELIKTFLNWIVNDLKPVNDKTLEQTRIQFYPSATMGEIKVLLDESIETYINAAQSISIRYTVSKQVHGDQDVRKKIEEASIRVLSNELKKRTISKSSIISSLSREHGEDVIGISISNLANNNDITSFTIIDEGKNVTLRKKLVVQPDDKLSVKEDVTFDFIMHDSQNNMINMLY